MSAVPGSSSDSGKRSSPPSSAASRAQVREEAHAENSAEADELEMSSPEGRPADPGVRARTTIVLVAIAIAVVVVAAALIARAGNPWLAAGIALAGLIFVIVFNPIVWASVLRVREREKVHHEHEHAAGRD